MHCSLKSLKKFTKNPYFGGSWSFKVIDVGTTGKLVGSACSKSTSLETRDTRQSRLSHSEDFMILSFVVLTIVVINVRKEIKNVNKRLFYEKKIKNVCKRDKKRYSIFTCF